MYYVKKLYTYSSHSVTRHIKLDEGVIGFYHMVFMLKGKMTIIANGETYVLHENDIMLIPPKTLRERKKGEEPTKYVIFNFHPYDNVDIPLKIVSRNAITPNIKKLLSLYPYSDISAHNKAATPEMQKILKIMQNILNCILIELLDSKKYETNNPHVINAMKFINDNITSRISLNEVSEAIHISKEYTSKIFKEETGKTVTEYINEQKMLLAKDMLSSNEVSLRDTAANLGYENYSYFSRVFKKHFNTSPAKLKNSTK